MDELGPPTRLYTDGSYYRMGSGWAFVVVSPDGLVLAKNSGNCAAPRPASPELRAVLEGLRGAMTIGHRNLVVFTDSSDVIGMVHGTVMYELHRTERRSLDWITRAIECCKRVQFVFIGGKTKRQEPHRRWHRIVDKASRDCAKGMNRGNLKRLARVVGSFE